MESAVIANDPSELASTRRNGAASPSRFNPGYPLLADRRRECNQFVSHAELYSTVRCLGIAHVRSDSFAEDL
jgi:hypothetical protein